MYDFTPTNFLVRHCGAMQVGIRKMERLVTPCLAFIQRGLLRMCQPRTQVKKRWTTFSIMPPHNLRLNPLPEDSEWRFTVPPAALALPRNPKPGVIYGKGISFTAEKITIQMEQLSSNRILRSDDPSKFIRVSFGGLRFPDSSIRVTSEYISRLMKSGLFLNGKQYRFYHHSNSQLVSKTIFTIMCMLSHMSREKGRASSEKQTATQSSMSGFINLVISGRL